MGEIKQCRKTLTLRLLEGIIALVSAITSILLFGKSLLALFNNEPQVVADALRGIVLPPVTKICRYAK